MDDYQEKYKCALVKATSYHEDPNCFMHVQGILENIFPELAESEDERIRKKVIATIHLYYGEPLEDEAKEMIAWLEKQGERKEATCVAEIIDHLTEKEQVILFKELEMQKKQKPAWSEEDEKYWSIVIAEFSKCAGKSVSKDEWMRCNDFLNSLRDRVQPKQEWSEEDCNQIEMIACHLDNIGNGAMAESLLNIMNKYKSCRPQNTWKPSDEHYELEEFAKIVRGNLTGISRAVIERFEAKYLQLTGNKMYGGFKD